MYVANDIGVGVTAMRTVDVLWAAIVSWGHADSIIRLKNRKDLPAVNFMHWRTHEQVQCCSHPVSLSRILS